MKVEIELDDLNELREQLEAAQSDLANQVYAGNSISYIHSKMMNYRKKAGLYGDFVRTGIRHGFVTEPVEGTPEHQIYKHQNNDIHRNN